MCVQVRPPRLLLPLALIVSAAACTGRASTGSPSGGASASLFLPSAAPSGGPPGEPSSIGSAKPPIVLPVIATTSGPLAAEDRGYVDGMRLAVQEIDRGGGVKGRPLALDVYDDGGEPDRGAQAIDQALDQNPPAILYVGPGEGVTPVRARLEREGTPLILLSGDLYTTRGLFPEVFQDSIPWEWQANVIARYVVVDRKAKDVVFIGEGSGETSAADVLRAALAYWGGRLDASFTDADRSPTKGFARAFNRAARADWAVVYGSSSHSLELVNAIEEEAGFSDVTDTGPKPGVSGPAALLASDSSLARPEPGTVACSTYSWAGWAQAIPRVGAFRTSFAALTGRPADGTDQEGYEAVGLLSWGLHRTGASGDELVDQLEQAKGLLFSSFPIDLGPDDHVLPPRDQLGLYAVAGPDEKVDPWQIHGTEPWRAIMRTFTYDGQRTSILDTDRTVFFPWWNKNLPGPHYWRSIYGIVTRPKDDRLH
jgi:ABC-type branched-subunit amino acid transport system substrate-binding protein